MKVKQISAVLSGALLIGSLSPSISQAATQKETPVKTEQAQENQSNNFIPIQTNEQFNQTLNTTKTFTPYVKVNAEGLLYINATADEIGITNEEYQNFLNGLNLENDYIKKGYFTLEKDEQGNPGKLSTTQALNSYVNNDLGQFKELQSSSAGFYGWGFGLKLSNSETQSLAEAMAWGSAAIWVAAELAAAGYVTIPASVPLGLIAAIVGLGAATLAVVNKGKGVTVGITWTGHPHIHRN
ncbi:hypothetical protein P4388_25560 [Bacillus thuringiensis]|uniref:hypothetical protein n=1 Tax=Bacillus TaxID=1386 RepID=UPI002E1E51DD|nr:hypothetical protein [Bacillus thuringiensis]